MSTTPAESAVIERVRTLVLPIATDLSLDLYDVEQRGGTIRVTLDTPPGSPEGVNLDTLALRIAARRPAGDDASASARPSAS
jgi:ribosome maturation factor RimP